MDAIVQEYVPYSLQKGGMNEEEKLDEMERIKIESNYLRNLHIAL